MLALGDKKGLITIWHSGVAKPVFKMQLSETKHTITDMSWSRCGMILLVTCLDGFMSAIKFEDDELPSGPMSEGEMNDYFMGEFGLSRQGATVSDGRNTLVQSALQMRIEAENKAATINVSNPASGARTMASPSKSPSDTLANQVVTKTKKGKKRIAPVMVAVR